MLNQDTVMNTVEKSTELSLGKLYSVCGKRLSGIELILIPNTVHAYERDFWSFE